MPPILKTLSRKQKAPRDWTYLLGLGDVQAALEPQLSGDAHLSLYFTPVQDHWKERRDERVAARRYQLFEATYSPGGEHLPPRGLGDPKPWEAEERPQVVTGRVFAVPMDALPKGVPTRPILRELLFEAFLKLSPLGLPASRTPLSPRNAWILEVGLDGNTHTLSATLKPWNGVEHAASERLERVLSEVRGP